MLTFLSENVPAHIAFLNYATFIVAVGAVVGIVVYGIKQGLKGEIKR